MFSDTKVVYSLYNDDFPGSLDPALAKKLLGKEIKAEHLTGYQDPTFINISKAAIDYSDGIILGHQNINPELEAYARASKKPLLEYQSMDTYIDAFNDFYDEVLVNESVVSE